MLLTSDPFGAPKFGAYLGWNAHREIYNVLLECNSVRNIRCSNSQQEDTIQQGGDFVQQIVTCRFVLHSENLRNFIVVSTSSVALSISCVSS